VRKKTGYTHALSVLSAAVALLAGAMPAAAAAVPCDFQGTAPLQAGQTLTFIDATVCTFYGAWLIESGATLVNGGNGMPTLFINGSNDPDGWITFDTAIENRGQIDNRLAAAFHNTVSLTNYGLVNNEGYFRVTALTGFVNNLKDFNNSGTLQIDAAYDLSRASFANAGMLVNTGLVDNSGRLLNNQNGTIQLSGANAQLLNRFLIDNYGTITIQQGRLESQAYFTNQAGATLENNGELIIAGFGLRNDGTVKNHGLMQIGDAALLSYGSFENSGALAQVLVDTGSINVFNTLNNAATMTIGVDGALSIQTGGELINTGLLTTSGLTSNVGTLRITAGTFTNEGTFYNDALLVNTATFINRSFLQNTGTMQLRGVQTFETGTQLINVNTLTLGGSSTLALNANISNYYQMEVESGATFVNDGGIVNSGSLLLRGQLSGGNIINNVPGATFEVAGGTYLQQSEFYNSGTFTLSSGSMTNSGTIINAGSFEVRAGASFSMSGVLASDGSVTLGGVVDLTGGRVDNYGFLTATIPVDFGAPTWGTIALLSSGTFINQGGASVVFGYTQVNAGRIDNQALFTVNGTLDNQGNVDGGSMQVNGSFINRAAATLATLGNVGSVRNDASLNVFAALNNGGTLTNQGTLEATTVNNTGTLDNGALAKLTMSSLDNSSSTSNAGHVVVRNTLSNSGHYTASSASLTEVAQLNNSGQLDIANNALFTVGGALNNTGQISSSGELRVGGTFNNGEAGSATAASFVNLGQLLVQSGAHAVNNALLSNSGTLTNSGQFDNRGQLFSNGTLRNVGFFTNYASAGMLSLANTGGLLNQGNFTSATIDNAARTTNRGTMQATTLNSSGQYVQEAQGVLTVHSDFDNSGIFENAGSVLAEGGLRTSGSFINTGSMTLATPGNGALVDWGGSVSNVGTLLNYGAATINPNVQFTNAGLIVNRGSWTGNGSLTGSGRIENSLQWTSSGTTSAAAFANTGTLLIDGGVATITALSNSGTVTQQGGQLNTSVLQNDGRLSLNGGVFTAQTFSNRGTVTAQGSAQISSLNLNNDGTMALASSASPRFDAVTNSGTLTASNLRVQQLNNLSTGRFQADTGMQIDGTFVNQGTATFYGDSYGAGDYRQDAGYTAVNGLLSLATMHVDGGRVCGIGSLGTTAVFVNGGTLCPGLSPGTLTLDGALLFRTGALEIEIAGTTTGAYDQLVLNGTSTFVAGVLHLVFINGYVPQAGDHWLLIAGGGAISGLETLSSDAVGLPAGYALSFAVGAEGLTLGVTPVPEPATCAMWLSGLAFAGLVTRRRKAAAHQAWTLRR
jgi:hypothetical protein